MPPGEPGGSQNTLEGMFGFWIECVVERRGEGVIHESWVHRIRELKGKRTFLPLDLSTQGRRARQHAGQADRYELKLPRCDHFEIPYWIFEGGDS
jgi:hypothetical protein